MDTTRTRILALLALPTLFSACVGEIDGPIADDLDESAGEIAFPDEPGEDITVELPFESGPVTTTARLLDDDRLVVMGDIVLSRRELGARATGVVLGRRWINGVVPYNFASGATDARVTSAIATWQQATNITFVLRTTETDYVQFVNGATNSGCSSDYLGRKGGKQIVNLEAGACTTGNAIHEIGHVVGLSHEQNRTDRDSFIRVDTTQVAANNVSQFSKIDGTIAFNLSGFDFGSVMMYGPYAFVTGATPVMTRLDGTTGWVGQRNGLSDMDRASIWVQYRTSATSSIRGKWDALGSFGSGMGYPVTGEYVQVDGVGYKVDFQTGSIYWSPWTGAHDVRDQVRTRWLALGGPSSFLGYPTSDRLILASVNGAGFANHFQNGSIYWSAATGAQEIYGQIRAKWASYGSEQSWLGYPTTPELATPDGIGRYNHFQNDASIYWTATTGAITINGSIRTKWAQMGWERSCLGYPTADALKVTIAGRTGRKQSFQHGTITSLEGLSPTSTCN